MNNHTTYHDTDLREAVRRVELQRSTPEPSADFLQAVMRQIQAETGVASPTPQPMRRRQWPWVAASIGAAAAIVIAVIMLLPDTSSVKPEDASVLTEDISAPPANHPSCQTASTPQMVQAKPSVRPSTPAPITVPRKQSAKVKQEKPMKEPAMSTNPPGTEPPTQPAMKEEPIALSDLVADPPTLSPEKQALVNIYLAETALQVKYDRQAQQQAVRAYQTGITGHEEPAQHIIAF